MIGWTIMFIRVLVEVAVVNRALLPHLWLRYGSYGGDRFDLFRLFVLVSVDDR